jgi:glycosyltransferase involved in cell wall biosynthesis
MRIVYFAHVNGGGASGVLHKIAGQVDHWRAHGHRVRVLVATRDEVTVWASPLGDAVVRRYAGAASRVTAISSLVRDARAFHPDLIYQRWDLFYPPMLLFPKGVPLVAEVNSDDLQEYALGRPLRSRYNARTRGLVLGRAGALVFVTRELSDGPSFRGFLGIHRVVTNGIVLDSYPELAAPDHDHVRLVFVGTQGQSWHGIDRLVRLAELRPGWQFDIVGVEAEGQSGPANVTWHGPLDRRGVLAVLANADVGVGTLALHRKSMTEACPLKMREYLAVGLPVVYAYSDPDVDLLGSYALRIANSESNVEDELATIDAFVVRSKGLRVPRASIVHIDIARKEAERLALFDEVAGR